MSDSPLLISTLVSSNPQGNARRAQVPCVTLLCHPDPRRIGERALLTALLVRKSARLSRSEPLFAHPGGDHRRPLEDPYLSREPLRIACTADGRAIVLENLPDRVQLDGVPVCASCTLGEDALAAGVLLQVSSRILLLLHTTAGEALVNVDGILGASDAIDRVRRQLLQVAALDTPILIRGESGVGKERVAQALHQGSARKDCRLVALNMATLGESTAPAALFGYARGAFTGASARHHGHFEQADGGTLFLDELGDTPQSVQPMLLRALETGRIQPLGDEQERTVNVRVIAATEFELEAGSSAHSFRLALRHRLAGYEIFVPPLRERRDDMPRLLLHFLREELRAFDRESLLDATASDELPPLRAEFMARLVSHQFPGNVRELHNLARQLALGATASGRFELSDAIVRTLAVASTVRDQVRAAASGVTSAFAADAPAPDEAQLLAALEKHDYSPGRAAAELAVPASSVHFWMRKAGIRRAADLEPAEIATVLAACGGDANAAAKQLRVSVRALALALRRNR